MNRILLQICLIISVGSFLTGCFDPPEYSDVPKIKFKELRFIDSSVGADSLTITFDFEDGDGDIGLREIDTYPPFHPYYFVVNSEGFGVTYTMPDSLVKPPFYLADPFDEVLSQTDFFSDTDNRPEFNCDDYYFGDGIEDTFFIVQNKYHSNLIIDFLFRKNGIYQEVTIGDFLGQSDCSQEVDNLRIPIFDYERINKPTTGTISYSFVSQGLKLFLAQDTFKLKFFVYDRALNQSNEVETPEFTLSDILQ
ncbi:hypothetical protein [Marinoscillum sp. MHG1-6]|uniref:hypothetical protein n=1 Tax=Marinoscillum sp. MHG1-6 TaxID=2959627 RepID=UPI0021570CAD|nr:hypothetical protein [Marinoscillum sp. MHG1-6]